MRTLCPRLSSDVQFAATTTHLEASALGLELWTAVTSPRSVLQQLPSKARRRRPNFTRAAADAAAARAASPSNGCLSNQRPTWDPRTSAHTYTHSALPKSTNKLGLLRARAHASAVKCTHKQFLTFRRSRGYLARAGRHANRSARHTYNMTAQTLVKQWGRLNM